MAFVSMTHSMMILPAEFTTAIEMLSLCTSMPIYFVPFMRVLLFVGLRRTLKTYFKRGALYIASANRTNTRLVLMTLHCVVTQAGQPGTSDGSPQNVGVHRMS